VIAILNAFDVTPSLLAAGALAADAFALLEGS
jgi:hypothetical protein